jgi:hypothetical protein
MSEAFFWSYPVTFLFWILAVLLFYSRSWLSGVLAVQQAVFIPTLVSIALKTWATDKSLQMAFGGVLNVVGFATAGLLLFLIYHIQKTRRLPLTAWISAIIVAMILTLILTSVELPIATRLRQITSTYF